MSVAFPLSMRSNAKRTSSSGSVIREYEQRKKKIDALTARLQEIENDLDDFSDKIKEPRDQWKPELD